jgi:hypothetical protein
VERGTYGTESTGRACASAIAVWKLALCSVARITRGLGTAGRTIERTILGEGESREEEGEYENWQHSRQQKKGEAAARAVNERGPEKEG